MRNSLGDWDDRNSTFVLFRPLVTLLVPDDQYAQHDPRVDPK